jgi:hypothetical protein
MAEILPAITCTSAPGRDSQHGLTIKRISGQKVTNFLTLFLEMLKIWGKREGVV